MEITFSQKQARLPVTVAQVHGHVDSSNSGVDAFLEIHSDLETAVASF